MNDNKILNGILLLNKPVGMSSRKLLGEVQKKLNLKKTGHTGTLDPLAEGLIILLTGNSRKLQNLFTNLPKIYQTTIFLGGTSETDDLEGPIKMKENAIPPSLADVEKTLKSFIGEIEQIPPFYSAIKVNGQRAYKLKRQGEEFSLKSRKINIYNIKLIKYNYPELEINVSCSAGTYIRSLARDLGDKLNTGGYIKALKRLSIGNFNISESSCLEKVNISDILTLEDMLKNYSSVILSENYKKQVIDGQEIFLSENAIACLKEPVFIWIEDKVMSLAKLNPNSISTKKLLI